MAHPVYDKGALGGHFFREGRGLSRETLPKTKNRFQLKPLFQDALNAFEDHIGELFSVIQETQGPAI